MNETFDIEQMGAEALGDGFEAVASLLALEDSQFKLVAPVFLDELSRSLNDPAQEKDFLDSLIDAVGAGSVDKTIKQYMMFAQAAKEDEELKDIHKDFFNTLCALIVSHLSGYDPNAQKQVAIPIELCKENAKIPAYARKGDAGLDVYLTEDIDILPGQTVVIPVGIKVAVPEGYELQVRPKSGISSKTSLRVILGTIDSGYRGEVGIMVQNSDNPIQDIDYHFDDNGHIEIDSILHSPVAHLEAGQKIAQLVLNKVELANFYEVSDITAIAGDRGGGFGSTGV